MYNFFIQKSKVIFNAINPKHIEIDQNSISNPYNLINNNLWNNINYVDLNYFDYNQNTGEYIFKKNFIANISLFLNFNSIDVNNNTLFLGLNFTDKNHLYLFNNPNFLDSGKNNFLLPYSNNPYNINTFLKIPILENNKFVAGFSQTTNIEILNVYHNSLIIYT